MKIISPEKWKKLMGRNPKGQIFTIKVSPMHSKEK